jgi:hypothetical protein
VILATGLQSSGSTLLSWCFLQRPDMDGVLDGDTDLIPLVPPNISRPFIWYKTTISAFSLEEQVALLEDEGYKVKPLLVVRDVRAVWMSLMRKPYGRNGVTAEDPPLRQRMRRFLRSWHWAQQQGIPLYRFEDLRQNPEAGLRQLCSELGIVWDTAMLDWPKPPQQISDMRHGNARFRNSDKQGLASAINPEIISGISGQIHADDLQWLDTTFAGFNVSMGYEQQIPDLELLPGRYRPGWDVSRRLKWRLRQKPVRHLLCKLGVSRYTPRPQ